LQQIRIKVPQYIISVSEAGEGSDHGPAPQNRYMKLLDVITELKNVRTCWKSLARVICAVTDWG